MSFRSRTGRVITTLLFVLIAAGDTRSRAAEADASTAPDDDASEVASATPASRLPVFVPPNRGAPKSRVGGATRGKQRAGTPSLAALVPEDGGLTVEAQPVLYWYLSESTTGRVDVTIVDEASVTPLLEATIPGPLTSGVHPIRLADHGVSLAQGVDYQWFVALVPDAGKRSDDVIAGGGIERIAVPAPLRDKLAAASGPARSSVLAEAGIWYDALDATSRAIDASPHDGEARDSRAALLEQVGLTEVALLERGATVKGER